MVGEDRIRFIPYKFSRWFSPLLITASQSCPKVSDKNSYKIRRFILSFLEKVKKDIL